MKLDRRSLLVAGGAGVGLVVAFSLWPRDEGQPVPVRSGEQLFDHYLKIGTDGQVTAVLPQAETGQGIWTGLAQVIADALGAAWETVAVEPAPHAARYANHFFDSRVTAGATSIRAFEQPLREAGALARSLIVRAAAERWDVDEKGIVVAGGIVRHGPQALRFGELVEAAAALKPGSGVSGKLGTRLVGEALPRLDTPAKAQGSIRFAGDVRLPAMVFASARLAPLGGRITGFDRASARAMDPEAELVAGENWIAALANDWWRAERALAASQPRFSGPAGGGIEAVWPALDRALDEGLRRVATRGGGTDRFDGSKPLEATYRIAPALHLGLEPLSAVARMRGGRLEIWAATQAYDLELERAAKAVRLDARDVLLYPMPVGAPGGGAIENDAIPIAIDLARRTGRPVSVTLSASQTQNRSRPRAPMIARMRALPERAGGLAAWHGRFASGGGIDQSLARLSGKTPVEPNFASFAPPYGVADLELEAALADLAIPCGYMRGGLGALAAFATESFVDETARKLGREPVAFRMAMLGGNPRLAKVLDTAARAAGWDGGGEGSAMGIACASAFGSHIALVAQASLTERQEVDVERLVVAVDCGRAINPQLIRQQVEGSLIDAIALATMKAPDFVAGMPKSRRFARNGMAPALQHPDIEVELVGGGDQEPGGVSGLGHWVLAAAVANSLAARTGLRLRNLPFDPIAA